MGTKTNPGPFDCYAAAAPDEPMFILLGRDPDAAALVCMWAAMCRLRDSAENGLKIAEAEQCAEDMVKYLQGLGKEPAGVFTVAQATALFADLSGAVLTVTLQAREPLSMGNYYPIVEVRPKLPRSGA